MTGMTSTATTMSWTSSAWRGLFVPVISLWQALDAIDDDDCLTPLGWWGLPEATPRLGAVQRRSVLSQSTLRKHLAPAENC